MPGFTITRQIDAPVDAVWQVLDDFGDIQRWNPGVTASSLTSEGPVSQGSTRHCDFAPFGGVDERIAHYDPARRMTIDLIKTYRLPISWGQADFNLNAEGAATTLTLNYSYNLNLLGRLVRGYMARQMEKGIGGLAASLAKEAEELAAA